MQFLPTPSFQLRVCTAELLLTVQCGMPTYDAHSFGHLVPLICSTSFPQTCRIFQDYAFVISFSTFSISIDVICSLASGRCLLIPNSFCNFYFYRSMSIQNCILLSITQIMSLVKRLLAYCFMLIAWPSVVKCCLFFYCWSISDRDFMLRRHSPLLWNSFNWQQVLKKNIATLNVTSALWKLLQTLLSTGPLHHARIYSGSYHVKVKVSFKDFFNLESLGDIGSEFLFNFRHD